MTYRALDGTLRDYPSDESVCLLKRANWFLEYVQVRCLGSGCHALQAPIALVLQSVAHLLVIVQPTPISEPMGLPSRSWKEWALPMSS